VVEADCAAGAGAVSLETVGRFKEISSAGKLTVGLIKEISLAGTLTVGSILERSCTGFVATDTTRPTAEVNGSGE
jgi:hypothetical protein